MGPLFYHCSGQQQREDPGTGRPSPLLHGKSTGPGGAPRIAVCSKISSLARAALSADTPTH